MTVGDDGGAHVRVQDDGKSGERESVAERWRRFADIMGDCFFVLDPELRCTSWNEVCAGLWGIPAQEAVGRLLGDLPAAADCGEAEEACRRALLGGKPRRLVVEVEAPGRPRNLELTVCPIEGSVCVMGRDVTEQVAAQQELRASEARYRMLIEDVPAVTYAAALDDQATPLYVSPQAERLLGYPADRYQEEPDLWMRQVHPEDRDRIAAEMQAARADGRSLVTEYRVVRPDGSAVWFRDDAALVRDADGRPLYWQGVAFDITDRKKAEESLRQSEERYRTLVELSPDPIVVLVEGRIVFANRAAAHVLGFSGPQEVVGQAGVDMMHPDFKATVADRLQRAATGSAPNAPIEMKVVRHDGVERDIESVSLPVTFHGRPAVQVVFRDVTEHKATDERLHDYREALRALACPRRSSRSRNAAASPTPCTTASRRRWPSPASSWGLSQELTGDEQTAGQLEEVRRLIQQCIDYTRTLVSDLSPPILYEMGLEAALSRLTENMEKQYGISHDIRGRRPAQAPERRGAHGALPGRPGAAGQRRQARRALPGEGVHRHEDGGAVVRVEDDGAGFDAAGDGPAHARRRTASACSTCANGWTRPAVGWSCAPSPAGEPSPRCWCPCRQRTTPRQVPRR